MLNIQDQRYGVEIEVVGAYRGDIAAAVAQATQGTITSTEVSRYQATQVTDLQGRIWSIQNDTSIATVKGYRGSEIVTPILHYDDLSLLQLVVRQVKACGACAHTSCAVHIHVDASAHTPESLSRLAKMVYKNEGLIFDALQVHPDRRARYTRPMSAEFIQKIAHRQPKSEHRLNEYWYGRHNPHPQHYDLSRYHGLNLNNLWRDNGTIEFRYFNSTLHAGKIKAYVQFCLALSTKALNSRAASHKKVPTDNPKFNFRVWLVATLGMKGNEFKIARYHLTRYLPGNSAWRYGQPNKSNNQTEPTPNES